jgi:Cd2+/Zn2+-exporting ATPase
MVSTLDPSTEVHTPNPQLQPGNDVPERMAPRRAPDDAPAGPIRALLEEWGLIAAAAACWSFLILAALLDHLTGTSQLVISMLYVAAYLAGGTLAARAAIADLLEGHVNVDLLMITAAIGAALVDAWGEGAVLLALFSSSNALEHAALDRTRRAVQSLMELSPEAATVVRDGREVETRVEEIAVGDLVRIRPGERIPVDAEVVEGFSELDQASITGESVPVEKHAGDQVFAGTLNGTGALLVRVTRHAGESTLARIVRVVEEAREQKSRTQRFAEAFEGRYAVGVLVFSALVFLVPWLALGRELGDSFYQAMTLLVVLSPCALVISTPASTLSALANAARHGVLFKGGGYLERINFPRQCSQSVKRFSRARFGNFLALGRLGVYRRSIDRRGAFCKSRAALLPWALRSNR